jgi:hypothetical protein
MTEEEDYMGFCLQAIGGEGVAPCKVNYDPTTAKDMLLMAPSAEEQQLWVSRLLKKIQVSGP